MTSEPGNPTSLIAAYRAGDSAAGNALLQRYEPWLKLLARVQMESRFQAKFDPSDLVQQAMLEAVRSFPQFRGTSETELGAWLRQILAHVLAHEVRRYQGTQKRDLRREVSLEAELEASSQNLGNILAASGTSPGQKVAKKELAVQLASLLERLPADHREVIILRNLEGLTHEEAARRMGRTPGATRMLWLRALAKLSEEAKVAGISSG